MSDFEPDTKNHGLVKYLSERDQILINLSVSGARENFPSLKNAGKDLIMMSLHKARYEATSIPDRYRHESAGWLRARGLKRLTGDRLLKQGELPE